MFSPTCSWVQQWELCFRKKYWKMNVLGYCLRRALVFIQVFSFLSLQTSCSGLVPTHLFRIICCLQAGLHTSSLTASSALLSWISQYRGVQVKCIIHTCPYWSISYIQIYLSCQPAFLRATLLFMFLMALNLIYSGKIVFVERMNEWMNDV